MPFRLVHGVVTGVGGQADCRVLVETEAAGWSCAQFMIIEAPRDFPDGIYRISFDAFTGYTRKLDGLWLHQTILDEHSSLKGSSPD